LIIININSIFLLDKNTGKLIDKIDIHKSNRNFLDGNIWGGSALDEKNGILFVSVGNPSPATYGVKRPGKNERSNSVIAIDLKSRSVIWHFQEVAHDLWDFDITAPPIIHNLKINNNFYEVVIVPTKVGNTLILERKTGKPIFDVFYKKAPISDIPGEFAEPYQLFIEKPEPFSKIEYSEKDFEYLDNSKKEEIKKKLFNSKYGWYETPSFNKDLIMFGLHGGAQWQGASLDPLNQYLYIPVNNVPWKIRPFFVSSETSPKVSNDFVEAMKIYKNKCSSCHGNTRNGNFVKKGEKLNNFIPSLVGNLFRNQDYNNRIFSSSTLNYLHSDLNITDEETRKLSEYFKWWDNELVKNNEMFVQGGYKAWSQFLTSDDLPGSNPPWGYIAKLDLVNGKIIFKTPIGYKNINGKHERVGTTIFGGVASNKAGIIFATGTEDALAYAIDGQTGKELWTYQMDATGSAPPLIYTYKNKQYVSFLSTGGSYHNYKGKNSALYTFTITK
jgi:quinoprotein glucose dehydrogenase